MDALIEKLQQAIDLIEVVANELDELEDRTKEVAVVPVAEETRKIAWGKRVSPEFKAGVLWIEEQIKLDPDKLMACMAFETGGTFSPSIKNPASSATGLLQFMKATIEDMLRLHPNLRGMLPNGHASLKNLSAVQQLSLVFYYFKAFGKDLSNWSVEDVYMAILLPSMIGKPLDTPMRWSQSAYRVNAGLDLNRDKTVTKREAAHKVTLLYAQGKQEEFYG